MDSFYPVEHCFKTYRSLVKAACPVRGHTCEGEGEHEKLISKTDSVKRGDISLRK